MLILDLEQNNATYSADFALYGAGVAALAAFLCIEAPPSMAWLLVLWGLAGLPLWTLIEYGVHRFVLHHIPPFAAMHEMHHRNPRALIGTPTVITAAMFAGGVFLPAFTVWGTWRACALMLGVLVGYLAYAVLHHGAHHWHGSSALFLRRKHIHGRHHQYGATGNYGVTTSLWDRLFRTNCR